VLVISPDAFNAATQTPVVVPITTGGAFARNRGFTVSLAALTSPPAKLGFWNACQPQSWMKCWPGWQQSLLE
jgi:mRNA-degrading endonuclease toxin of MazEF toxin-antitoxin module